MATYEHELQQPPDDDRSRELWLQHGAGLIYFEDARQYAIDQIEENSEPETREKIVKGINDALYGMMMILDGVSGCLENDTHSVTLDTKVNLTRKSDGEIMDQLNLLDGDGMCMGYHGWLEGDFGEIPVARKKDDAA